jgi:hypothetical protein
LEEKDINSFNGNETKKDQDLPSPPNRNVFLQSNRVCQEIPLFHKKSCSSIHINNNENNIINNESGMTFKFPNIEKENINIINNEEDDIEIKPIKTVEKKAEINEDTKKRTIDLNSEYIDNILFSKIKKENLNNNSSNITIDKEDIFEKRIEEGKSKNQASSRKTHNYNQYSNDRESQKATINQNSSEAEEKSTPEDEKREKNEKNEKSEKEQESNFNKTNFGFFKADEVNNIIRRALENNKKEAAAKNRDFLTSNYPQNYMNINLLKTKNKFFIGANNEKRPFTEDFKNKPSSDNYMEISLNDVTQWKKHEEIWQTINSGQIQTLNSLISAVSSDLEKYLIPPNDFDILSSSFYKLHFSNCKQWDKIIINDKIANAVTETQKWKAAYKRVVQRWHPDKLFPILDKINFKDESRRGLLKKKASVFLNNVNKSIQSIYEILRKIQQNHEKKG